MSQNASLLFRGAAEARPVGVISKEDEAALLEVGKITGIDEVTLKYFIVVWNRINLRASEREALLKQAHLFKTSGLDRDAVEGLLELFREHRRTSLDRAGIDGPSIAYIMGEIGEVFPERVVFEREKELWAQSKAAAVSKGEEPPKPVSVGVADPKQAVAELPVIPPAALEQLRSIHAGNLASIERTGQPLVRSVPLPLVGRGGAPLSDSVPEGMVGVVNINTGKVTLHDKESWDAAHGPSPAAAAVAADGGGGGGVSSSEQSCPQIPASQTLTPDSTTETLPSPDA